MGSSSQPHTHSSARISTYALQLQRLTAKYAAHIRRQCRRNSAVNHISYKTLPPSSNNLRSRLLAANFLSPIQGATLGIFLLLFAAIFARCLKLTRTFCRRSGTASALAISHFFSFACNEWQYIMTITKCNNNCNAKQSICNILETQQRMLEASYDIAFAYKFSKLKWILILCRRARGLGQRSLID